MSTPLNSPVNGVSENSPSYPPTKVKGKVRSIIFLFVVAVMCAISAREFLQEGSDEPLFPSASLTRTANLSDYLPSIKNSRGDTEIYFFDSGKSGGTCLILGGTHANEPAGYLSAYYLIEHVKVTQGKLIVIPRANRSAMTHTEPTEAYPTKFLVGERSFRMGSRTTNPLDQWPDPEVYLHYPSKQELSGSETRNMNRSYPGKAGGNFTEKTTAAVTELIRKEKTDLVIDLHEASLEYPVINAIVAHDRAMDLAAFANLNLQAKGLNYALEPSPKNFHGLTHRELGDATDAMVVLMETANVVQGRLRGTTTAEKILDGKDDMYLQAAKIGALKVPYDSAGIPMEVRMGRHLEGIKALIDALAFVKPDRAIQIENIPDAMEIKKIGINKLFNSNR